MPANVYECLFLLDPNKVAGDVTTAAKQLHTILEKNHAEILASRIWSEHRLAYQIGNHKKGVYYLIYFRSEGKNLRPLESDLGLNEMILRQLILNIDPKLVDIMLAVARDEHAMALHTAHDADEGTDGAIDTEEHARPHRGGGGGRGGRRPVEMADKG